MRDEKAFQVELFKLLAHRDIVEVGDIEITAFSTTSSYFGDDPS